MDVPQIKELARCIRRDVLTMTYSAGVNGGHIGGALSSADILAVLYGNVLKISPETISDINRDRFILSKGHISIALYAALAECGFIEKEKLLTYEIDGSHLQTHSDMNLNCGIEVSSGSLGYGLPIGVGCALAAKMDGRSYKTYVLLGDGECNEGTIWEAAMAASKCGLNNLIAIVDMNNQQLDGYTSDVMPVHDLPQAFHSMGFRVIEIDGNDVEQLLSALEPEVDERPTAIISHTVKGKGIQSIEGKVGWHHARLTKEQYEQFSSELEAIR